ncbi:Crp/Fnr family transcriptional regulator [Sulfurivermis fontis]|uniref:Crp/Fnr family transcriptional regulator n=1 Tax=Sulfurivermis fontis TaxID=1972068 RepID=UPI000FDC3966|nr:Crp/Fnr family transcriptional regulator [Sulfurivermis fontis]
MAKDDARLVQMFNRLPTAERETLLAFAEFLVARSDVPLDVTPKPIERPAQESVVAAIKRLSASYHMLDRSKILHETSGLMTEHLMQGRAAAEVIDELEELFRRHYRQQFGDAE